MVEPLVSIIIPVYNRVSIIKDTLDCAINQDYPNLEIIVVDNCSTDGTYEYICNYSKQYSNIRVHRNETNLGPVRNWNVALGLVAGEFVKILWSDDQISKTFVSKTVDVLIKNKNVGFVYTKTMIYEDKHSSKLAYELKRGGIYSNHFFIKMHLLGLKDLPLSPGCALFRTIDVKANLLLDIPNEYGLDFSKYGAGNDLLIFLLTAIHYDDFYYIDEPLSYFRSHRNSFSIANDLSIFYVISKLYFLESHLKNSKLYRLRNAFYLKLLLNNKFKNFQKNVNYSKICGGLYLLISKARVMLMEL